MRFVEGEDRTRVTPLFERLNDYVSEENPDRVVAVALELSAGSVHVDAAFKPPSSEWCRNGLVLLLLKTQACACPSIIFVPWCQHARRSDDEAKRAAPPRRLTKAARRRRILRRRSR